jgi:tetraprenyl-beta-curcumene synthase
MIAAARESVAALSALGIYRAAVVPAVERQLAGWRHVAAAIADPGQRHQALAALDEKGLNVEAIAVFATLAPRRTRPTALRAMVALQVAIDYLDSVEEGGDDANSDYVGTLFATCRASFSALPSGAVIGAALEGAIARCGEGQHFTHAAERGDRPALEAWAATKADQACYRWWEIGAGASSSVAAHALIALAAAPEASAREAELVDAAYFPPIGALTVLLDDLIDRDEDAITGAHNYIAYYRDGAEAASRLELIVQRARTAVRPLRRHRRHDAILTGVLGFYLSDVAAAGPGAAPIRTRLLTAAGPGVRPLEAAMRLRRARKRPEAAGSVSGPY